MRFLSREGLSPTQQALMAEAEAISKTANCRYSRYPVGAALLIVGENGEEKIVSGNNYETLTYNSVCAEKAALMRAFAAHSWDKDGELVRPKVKAVAVFCAVGSSPQQPCGDCRQTLNEVNPDIEIIAAAGPALLDGEHDPRATVTTVRELLPHSFVLRHLVGEAYGQEPVLREPEDLIERVVHLPRADTLKTDRAAREALLQGVDHMLLVGSAGRARRIAEAAHARLGAAFGADEACYCDLRIAGRNESDREFAVYVVAMPNGARVAVCSHGIGSSGVEIVMSEVPAAIALAQGGEAPTIKGVIRSGTRGTLTRAPLGCTAISTRTCNESLDVLGASPEWLDRLRAAGADAGMNRVAEDEIAAHGESDWPEATSILIEGLGISTDTFWEGQGRPIYRPGGLDPEASAIEYRQRARLLAGWVNFGVKWIEMEDYAVHRIAARCGFPSATVGAVIAHRRLADGTFQLDYSKAALAASELIPTELALRAFDRG